MTRTLAADGYLTVAEWSYQLRQYRLELARLMRECRREVPKLIQAKRRHGKGCARTWAFDWADMQVGPYRFHGVRGGYSRAYPVAPAARIRRAATLRRRCEEMWSSADDLPCGAQDALGDRIDHALRIASYLERYNVTR